MKTNKIYSIALGIALFSLTACNHEESNTVEDGKVDVAKAIQFKVELADFNEAQDIDVTRTGNKGNDSVPLERQMVNLGHGILAQCTLQRDTTRQSKSTATRTLPNGTYTMLAYDATTKAFKGDMTGTVIGGAFVPADANKSIRLAPGQYDFVLVNSRFSRSGNRFTVERADAADALIGRCTGQTITAYPHDQQVSFVMKHVGAKVKIKLTSFMTFSVAATLESVNTTDVPSSSIYDADNDTWSIGAGAAMFNYLSFPTVTDVGGYEILFSALSDEETSFMPATDVSKLKLTLRSSTIYGATVTAGSLVFNPASTLKLEANGSYVLHVKLMYNFLYLMSNGDIGTVADTPYGGSGGTKTPIAVVLSRSKNMGIALMDAVPTTWATSTYWNKQVNTHMVSSSYDALNNDVTSGLDETWNASYSTSNVTGNKVKALNPDFPAFKAAAEYNPGPTYTGSPALTWYLPSHSDWTWAFVTLGRGDRSDINQWTSGYWKGALAKAAFTQVQGRWLLENSYFTSTQIKDYAGYHVGLFGRRGTDIDAVGVGGETTSAGVFTNIRPFVKY